MTTFRTVVAFASSATQQPRLRAAAVAAAASRSLASHAHQQQSRWSADRDQAQQEFSHVALPPPARQAQSQTPIQASAADSTTPTTVKSSAVGVSVAVPGGDAAAADKLDLNVTRPLAGPPMSSMLGMESGDLRLGDFMEEVKAELWQYNAIPFRRRFRVQSLLRRLQTPKFETWAHALKRPTDDSGRPFTRTLLAKHEGSPSVHLSVTSGFDLMLMCWKPGAMSPIHDHPNSGCWVKVLQGQVSETRYSPATPECTHSAVAAEGTGLIETSHATYGAGTVTYIDDSMGFHKMGNASEAEECISLHLYAPGMGECTTWADACSMGTSSRMDLDDNFVYP